MSEPAARRFTAPAAAAVRVAVAEASGNEVFFVGRLAGGLVHEVEVRCRGNAEAVPALLAAAARGDVVIHNHPSGVLMPSAADLHLAGEFGDRSVGFYIVDGACARCYAVVEPFAAAAEPAPFDVAALLGQLAPGGALATAHDGYEDRPQQRAMAAAVCAALEGERLLAVEAGTGTGKSLAYLLPAAVWAKRTGERVVVSTHTIALQEQLVGKDLPLLARLGVDVEVALVKGRGNYLCLRKLRQATASGGESALFGEEHAGALRDVAAWAVGTRDGSLADLGTPPPDDVWAELRVESDDCGGVRCEHYAGCFYFKARRRAARADLLVVNHHLLLADLALRAEEDEYEASFVLPPYARIVVDEAHHLEDAATAHFGERASAAQVRRLCGRLRHVRNPGRGLLPLAAARLEQAAGALPPAEQAAARALAAQMREDLVAARAMTLERAEQLFADAGRAVEQAVAASAAGAGAGGAEGAARLRIGPGFDQSTLWLDELYPPLAELSRECAGLGALVARTAERAGAFVRDEGSPLASSLLDLAAVGRRLVAQAEISGRFLQPDDERCRWIETQPPAGAHPRQLSLCAAPVDVGPALAGALHDRFGTVIATSATLTVAGTFDHFLARSGLALVPAHRRTVLRVESPFDFARQALLGVPTDLLPPDHPRAEERLARLLVEAAAVTGGRMLVLFTAYAALRRVYALVADPLAARGVTVRRQGDESRARLLDRLRAGGRTVLLATDSFWEGVDVPGDALSCVVVARLPFRVPSEPIVAARLEALTRRGLDAFQEYALPEAALRLRQGFGRLIRSRRDRGAVILADPRVVDRRYGEIFLASLPPARRVVGPQAEVLAALREAVA
ncbi:MAG TPA: helicase C-terminal domain-containing protein [Myxococcota bacterium]|jgi:ATP-dependent DNA helicase DinG|nr:helicase C-terminal domain-containing protein [Myxococcota bacterium]